MHEVVMEAKSAAEASCHRRFRCELTDGHSHPATEHGDRVLCYQTVSSKEKQGGGMRKMSA
jgi:hypothetical protein